jgi:hypothetical protein
MGPDGLGGGSGGKQTDWVSASGLLQTLITNMIMCDWIIMKCVIGLYPKLRLWEVHGVIPYGKQWMPQLQKCLPVLGVVGIVLQNLLITYR